MSAWLNGLRGCLRCGGLKALHFLFCARCAAAIEVSFNAWAAT